MPTRDPAGESGLDAVMHDLSSRGIAYQVIEHEETFSAVAEAVAAHAEPAAAGKTLVLRDHDRYRVVVLPAHRHLELRRVRELLGTGHRLRLATEAEMQRDFPRYEVGAVPALGPLVPAADVVDVRLLDAERILFAAGDHRHSVVIAVRDLLRATEPRVADVCAVRDDIEDW